MDPHISNSAKITTNPSTDTVSENNNNNFPETNGMNTTNTVNPVTNGGEIFMTKISGSGSGGVPGSEKDPEINTFRKTSVINGTGRGTSVESEVVVPISYVSTVSKVPRASLISVIAMEKIQIARKLGIKSEKWYIMMRDISVPFLIAGLGMVGAGILLDYVNEWDVYEDLPELTVLVTPFLGLKGNLEMTLASRLSTHANIGHMNDKREKFRICYGNLLLDQLQAIVCGLVASFFALCMNLFKTGEWPVDHMLLLTSASIVTASMVSIILGSVMIMVILLCRHFKINPDNIATPVAGSLGDVVTLFMLSSFSSLIWSRIKDNNFWVAYLIYSIYFLIIPVCTYVVYKNKYVKQVLISGWLPVLISVFISTGGGIILDVAGERFVNLALFQPLINGIGGNLVSVQASRIATQMHAEYQPKLLPGGMCQSPWAIFIKDAHAVSARLLLFLTVPGHIFFVTVVWLIRLRTDGLGYDFIFLAVFLIAAVVQVAFLLYFAKVLSNITWRLGYDPDVSTIPFLTACGDLIGSALLFLAFMAHASFI